jgi:Ca2+:H+ antiporter
LRDGKSNYLEGVLCVMTYIIIAICAFFFPNPATHGGGAAAGGESSGGH